MHWAQFRSFYDFDKFYESYSFRDFAHCKNKWKIPKIVRFFDFSNLQKLYCRIYFLGFLDIFLGYMLFLGYICHFCPSSNINYIFIAKKVQFSIFFLALAFTVQKSRKLEKSAFIVFQDLSTSLIYIYFFIYLFIDSLIWNGKYFLFLSPCNSTSSRSAFAYYFTQIVLPCCYQSLVAFLSWTSWNAHLKKFSRNTVPGYPLYRIRSSIGST